MAEYRKAQLTAAPTIEIGDINDITGVIYDKERHVTSGLVDVTIIGDNVGLFKSGQDIGSVTGSIADKERHVTSGVADVTIVTDNVGLAKDSTLSSVLQRSIASGTIDVVTSVGDITGTISDKERHITSGVVDVTIIASDVQVPTDIQAQYYSTVEAIASGTTLPANTPTETPAVDIDTFHTKTINGWINSDATVEIFTAPVKGLFHPYPYATETVSSGTTFSFSFTEAFAQVKVRITPVATGTAGIFVSRSVL